MAQYNVNLAFTADTGKARAQLQDLQKQLTNLINTPLKQVGLETDINKAAKAAAELKAHLKAATNVKTGNLDFVKLNDSLRKSNTSLKEYANTLRALGPDGQKAFLSLAQAVAQSEIPIRRSTEAVDQLWQTLKNTARWQISSSILHGFMGAVQTAYGYAQDLNGSLNDIRIVTGQNTEQMARFAKEANKAAKQLSTTTTQYTKASLIYYQQGLSDQEVKERTDITIKMANVARSNAQDVSDQLTAVWNNFYDGTKSLEHYADVMTALGAATASSTDEISEGLNKFAAVAETVGLSYEYAASALATVTATTRESADVVGNAFKTLFARIQGLKLGETLDDGTTLNKYSQALDSVGIKIQDVNGEIKDMDTILNELGTKWDTLGKDQQIALAQTVAGVRQYTQLIALMDNWDYFQKNLGVANTSAGALQEQADIYAESWEAAQDRVTAAAESIYNKLLDDTFFIDLLNTFEKILGFVDNLIDGLGGLKGVLLTLGSILTKVFNTQLSQTMTNMVYSIRMSTKAGREAEQKKRKETLDELIEEIPKSTDYTSDSEKARMSTMRQTLETQNALTENASRMSQIELETNQFLLDRVKILADANVEAAKSVEAAQKMRSATIENAQQEIINNFVAQNKDPSLSAIDGTAAVRGKLAQRQEDLVALSQMETALLKVKQQGKLTKEEITSITTSFSRFSTTLQGTKLQPIIQSLKVADAESEDWQDTIDNLQIALNILYSEANKRLVSPKGIGLSKETAQQMINDAHRVAEANLQASDANERFNKQIGATKKSIQESTGAQAGWADGMVAYAGTIMSVVSALQQVKGLIDVWNNEDMSFGEKLLTTFSTLAMVIPLVIHSFSALNVQQMAGFSAALAHALGLKVTEKAALGAAAGTATFGATLYTVLWPLGLILAAILLVVGVCHLLSKAFEKEATASEKAAQAVADQEKVVAKLNERLEETRSELESVKSLLEEYQKLDDAFDGLVEGSVEWLNALHEQNKVVQELIEKYPELIQMGAVGFKNGIYQILDMDLAKQYAQGKATVEMLQAELGATGAQYTLAQAQAEYNRIIAEQDLLWQKANSTSYKTTGTEVTSVNGNQFTVSSNISGKEFNATITDDVLSAAANKKGLDYIEPTVEHVLERSAMEVQSAMYNGVKTAGEAVQKILADDWNEKLGEYETFDSQGYQEMLAEVADHLYNAQSDYAQRLEALQAEEIRLKAILLNEFKVKWQMQAQSILSSQKGFSSLNALERQAATTITARQLQANADKFNYGVISQNSNLSVEFIKTLAEALNYDYEGSAIKWEDYFGNSESSKDIYNDAGDFFKVHTTFGDYLLNTYLAEVRGISGGMGQFEDEDGFERDSYKITFGDGQEVTYAEVLDYFASQAEYNATNYDAIMQKVQGYSEAALAAFTGNLQALDETTLLNSGLITKSDDGSYKLNKDSQAFSDAFSLWHSENKDLPLDEFLEQMDLWNAELEYAVKTYDAALANTQKLQADVAKGNAFIAQAAEAYDLDAEAVQNYAKSLYNLYETSEISYESIAKMAVANARLSKGVENLRKNWSDAATALSSYGKDSYEYYEALTATAAALTDIFGVEISAEFIEKNRNEIQKLVDGGDDAVQIFQELELAAAKDYVAHLDIDDSYKTQFQQLLTDLTELENSAQFGVGFTGTIDPSYLESLNALLASGAMTTEQIQSMFNSIGWDPNIEYDTVETKSEAINQIFTGNEKDVRGGGGQETWERIVTYSTTQIPKIGDKITATPKAPSSVATVNPSSGGNKKKRDDRFHYLEKTLDSAEQKYDKIAKARERAFGVDKLALYDQEIEKINDVINALDNYASEAEGMYLDDRKALLSRYDVVLDKDGNISNYTDLMAKYSSDETFQELIANYEESLEAWKEKTQEAIDKRNELLDLKLEKIQYKIDLSIKVDDQTQEYLDFLIEMADDPLDDAAKKLGYLTQKLQSSAIAAEEFGNNMKEALRETGWDDQSIDELLSSITSSEDIIKLLASNELTETQLQMLEQYRDQLYTTTQMMMTWADDIKDTVIEAFDKMGESFDESAEKLSHYNTILTSYQNIIDLVGQDTFGISDEVMGQLSQAQVDNAIASLSVSKEAHDLNKKALDDLRSSYNANWSDDAKEAWNEAVKHAEEKVRESEATLFESWENALQAAADAFEKAVETAVGAYEKAMSGIYGSFDAMQTAYDQQKTLSERYVQDYEKIYQLSKLNRAVQNSIDDTDNVKAKEELAKLQKDILTMSESDAEVSQYQLDSLQKQYDLKLAQIALEEAQNAKSQVRMQRDSEGNWSYVYTADQDNIENAQQNYEDKLFAFQDFTQKYIEENSDALMQLQQEYAEAMAGIKRENYATQEEYEEALQQTTEFYESMMNYHLGEIGLATTDAKKLYEDDWSKYSETTGYKISKDGEWITSWAQTKLALTTGYTEISDYQTAFKTNSELLISSLSAAYGTWKDSVDKAMEKAGVSMDGFAKQVEKDTAAIQGDTEKIVYALEDIASTASSSFEGVVTAAAQNYTQYSKWVSNYIAENLKLIASLNEVIRKKAQASAASSVTSSSEEDLGGTGTYTPPKTNGGYVPPVAGGSNSSPTTEDTDTDSDKVVTAVGGRMYSSPTDEDIDPWVQELIDNGRQEKTKDADPPFEVGDKVKNATGKKLLPYDGTEEVGYQQWIANKCDFTSGTIQDKKTAKDGTNYYYTGWTYNGIGVWDLGIKTRKIYFKESDLMPFDTGGYTGSWGSNGRLAMLHQKELVLNSADTENMLKAVEIVRKIVRVIDLNAANAANAFGALTATTAMTNDQIIEQEVTIHAEFPNATNHTEIEEAFNSLINRASQFANRKK